jgi:hypothetical protein
VALSPTLRRLLFDCQTWCKADCCKAEAFRFTERILTRWLEFERIDRSREIAAEIARIESELQHGEGQVFLAARGLESTWDLNAFRAFWKHLEEVFNAAVNAREHTGA